MFSALLRSQGDAAATSFTGRKWYAGLVLALSLALTAGAISALASAIRRTDLGRFQSAMDDTENRITRRMDGYAAVLRSAAGFFESHPLADPAAFAVFARHIDLAQNYPGSRGLGWSAPVPRGTEAEVERWLHEHGYPEARLWPAHDEAERQAVLMYEPYVASNRVIGYDMASEPIRREAMQRARVGRDPVLSAPVRLVRENGGDVPHGLLVLQAVPLPGAPPDGVGFVYLSLRSDQLLPALFAGTAAAPERVAVQVHDVTAGSGGAAIFASEDWDKDEGAYHTGSRVLEIGGRQWRISYRSTPWLERQSDAWLVVWFLGIGLSISIGLYLLARSQSASVRENAELYRRSLAARREAEINLDINRSLATDLDMQALAKVVIEAGRELVGAGFGVFLTTRDHDGRPVMAAAAVSGLAPERQLRPAPVAGLLRQTIEDREVVRLDDASAGPRPAGLPPGLPPVASALAVPVVSRSGTVIGALLYGHAEPGRFTLEHERLLLGLATQAAIAYDNASLFEAERDARRIAAHRAEDLAFANAELQQFVYVSSHDLQEPLRTITQYLGLLLRRHGEHLDTQALRYVTYAADSATRMHALLNDLLAYSRLGRGTELVAVPLGELVAEVVQDLRVRITETGATVDTGHLPTIRCDRSKMRLVFQNLIGNALKFRGSAPPRIGITACGEDSGAWTVSVSDNGIGIGPEHHRIIFEVFERLHDSQSFPGTGIGLAICKKVIEQHGGRIWVVSERGHGATFRFTLPADGSGAVPILKP